MTIRYWIGTASQDHARQGIAGRFAQCGHGKGAPLRRMNAGDWFIYYSPKTSMTGGEPLQAFTAIGRVQSDGLYQVEMATDFQPWRRAIEWLPSREAPIRPLLDQLSFTTGRTNWGFRFRSGHFEISEADFRLISDAMGVD